MENARAMARSSQAGKVSRMLGADNSSASVMKSESVDGTPVTTGLSGSDRGGVAVSGRTSKARMDKPSRARGGAVNSKKKGTNITVIVAPQGGGQGGADPLSAAMGAKLGALSGGPAGPGAGGPPPMPPQGGMPPGAPAGMPPGAGTPPPPRPLMAGQPVPMRAAGGRVARASGGMTAGAGSGLGREEKAGLRAAGGRVDMPASEKPKGASLKAQVAKIKPPSDPKPRKAKPDDGQSGFGFKRGGQAARC